MGLLLCLRLRSRDGPDAGFGVWGNREVVRLEIFKIKTLSRTTATLAGTTLPCAVWIIKSIETGELEVSLSCPLLVGLAAGASNLDIKSPQLNFNTCRHSRHCLRCSALSTFPAAVPESVLVFYIV